VVLARKLNKAGARNVVGEITPVLDPDVVVADHVEYQGRRLDSREHVPDVLVENSSLHGGADRGSAGQTLHAPEPILHAEVVGDARSQVVDHPARGSPFRLGLGYHVVLHSGG
jgi:hypothetical protein